MGANKERAGYRVERQLLALLSLFACTSVAGMAAVGLHLIQVPLWALTGAVASSFIICAWLAMRLLRRRFALLNRQQSNRLEKFSRYPRWLQPSRIARLYQLSTPVREVVVHDHSPFNFLQVRLQVRGAKFFRLS